MSLTDRIKAYARSLGFDWVGITPVAPAPHASAYREWLNRGFAGEMAYLERHAERRQHPARILPGARSLIVAAMNYYVPETDRPDEHGLFGVIARYARGADYHDVMAEKLRAVLTFIQAEADTPVQGRVYVDTGPILERDFAHLAGLGWFGKHTNLIHKRLGSWLLLGEILVDLALEYDRPATAHCGTCTRCIEACPTEAIVTPYTVDARRCISYLTIELKDRIPDALRPMIGNRIFGCDDCQDVCPWNRRAPEAQEPALRPRPGTECPSLLELIRMTPEAFRSRFKGSPIKRAKRRGLLRNVAVALGNAGDPRAVPALIDALHDEEPLVRGHAAWALGRLGGDEARNALERARDEETDAGVLKEIDHALNAMAQPAIP